MPIPELSITIAAQGSPDLATQCIQSLLDQNVGSDSLEIIVVEGPPYVCAEKLSSRFPSVSFLKAASTSIPMLHGLGVTRSSGRLIAITESHCVFRSDWARVAMKAHEDSAAVVGGAVEPGARLGALNTGLFLCDYAQFVPPMTKQVSADLPGNNIIFKRTCIDFSQDFAADGFWKTFFCHALESSGHELILEPGLVVFYNRKLELNQVMTRRMNHGRCFGGMRAQQASGVQRMLYFAAAPVLPAILFYKLFKRCARNERNMKMLVDSMLAVYLCVFLWAFAESLGNLLGPGTSCSEL
jgi:hypothetical protein